MLPAVELFLRSCGLGDRGLQRCDTLSAHLELLRTANADVNLTRLTSDSDYWVKHVADSLSVVRILPELASESLRVADVGSGAGFPAVPLACVNPGLTVVAVESRRRKAHFIAATAKQLRLGNLHVACGQAREVAQAREHRGQFDVVLLRAVGSPSKLLRHTRGLLKPRGEGRLVFYMTPGSCESERLNGEREARKYGLQVEEGQEAFSLPCVAGERQFVVFRTS